MYMKWASHTYLVLLSFCVGDEVSWIDKGCVLILDSMSIIVRLYAVNPFVI